MPSRGPVASREVELPGHAERSGHGAAFRGSEPSAGGAADLAATGGGATGRGPMVDLAKVARGSAGGGAARRVSGAGVFRDGRAADAGLPGDPGVPPQVRVGWHPAPGERTIAPAAAVVAGGALAVAGAGYLGWRASRLGGTGATGAVAFTAEVSLYLVLVGLAACLSRANRGFARRAPAPAGTLDVFVVSRGEPIADVDRSLRAARAITYPHRTFLLVDSRIDDATTPGGRGAARALVALAGRLDVACLVRDEGPPSRTAMLNGALARTDGDAVLLLDAGDAVAPDAAHRVLGYLRDPHVGLVSAAWRPATTGLGPLPDRLEPRLARLVSAARDRDGAVTGLGSGTLYRRTALETVGGFSSSAAAEEPRTSYELQAAGWSSVYHPEAVLSRAARPPATAARLTVARAADRLGMLLFDNPLAKDGLSGRQRAHHLADAAAPLLAAAQLGLWLTPALLVLGGGRIVAGPGTAGWIAFGLPYLASAVLFCGLVVAAGGCGGRGSATAAAGWLASVPLSLVALVRVLLGRVLLGRMAPGARGSGAAPDVARSAVLPAAPPAGVEAARSVTPRPKAASTGVGWRARRPAVLAGRPGLRAALPRKAGRPARPPNRVPPDQWTPLLLVLSLPAAGLAAALLVAVARPDGGQLAAVVWAGALLLLTADAVAAACALRWMTRKARLWLRVTVCTVVLIAAVLTVAAG